MLTEVLELLEKHGRLSLRELAGYFVIESAALEPILDVLMRKGRIRAVSAECSASGSCKGCSCSSREDMLSFEIAE
ncbi:MAG: FeoC-like transcriptional regulator [Candidatus Aegiribacteria sp.]|nr:FeoC-like transcriptional regulator [Candidatus Aegiribacteria sp.]